MLKYLEDNEDVKVGLSELKEQLEMPEEAGIPIMQIAKQAMNERGKNLFPIIRQGENEVYIASLARWCTQLKGLVELERRCQEQMQEVKLLSERQEVLAGLVEDKSRLQSKATEKCCETIYEDEGVGRGKSRMKPRHSFRKRTFLSRCQSERERTRMLQRLRGLRAIRHWTGPERHHVR